jgi:hypothetical protein
MKKLFLVLAIASGFLLGYAGSAKAWPGVADRDQRFGYFYNQFERSGFDVWPGGVPGNVWGADNFINFTLSKLAYGPGTQEGVGAAFIIETMIGTYGPSRSNPPAQWQIDDWAGRVRYADAHGWIDWNNWVSYGVNSYHQWYANDDGFYYNSGTDIGIIFRDGSGNQVYAIRRACANPVGDLFGLPPVPRYAMTGRVDVSRTTAFPGQTVTFYSNLGNYGPDYAENIYWRTRDASNGNIVRSGTDSMWPGWMWLWWANENFTIPWNAPFGSTYCRYMDFSPAYSGQGYDYTRPPTCVTVVAQYDLTPTVGGPATAQQNDTITFTYDIGRTGPTRSRMTNCHIHGMIYPANSNHVPIPQEDVDFRISYPGYVQPPVDCPRVFDNGITRVATETVNVGNLAPGQQICRSLVVDPRNQFSGSRSSAERCVVIAKTPYAHFFGNDVWAGGAFAGDPANPSCSTQQGMQPAQIQTVTPHQLQTGVAGSLSEYGAFAQGLITGFGTASQALGTWLTFSNMNNDGSLGNFNQPGHCINNYISKYQNIPVDLGMSLPGAIDVGARGSGTWHLTGYQDFKGIVPAGAKQVYLVDGPVDITGNITYKTGDISRPPTYDNVDDIPSIVIISTGGINVIGSVRQIDGTYATSGTFHTCDNHIDTLTINICNSKLVVNGAVIANRLNLRRTSGADGNDDTARKQPAELFNFNPELYLRNALNGNTSGVIKVMEQKDLPPRY